MVSRYTHQGYGEMFDHADGDPITPGDKIYYAENDYQALAADRDRVSLSLDLARADRDKWFERATELEAALRAATWLLHEDVPDDPPVEEDQHYARKAAGNAELVRLGIPINCYAPETIAEPAYSVQALNERICEKEGHVFPRIPVKECWRCHAQFPAKTEMGEG